MMRRFTKFVAFALLIVALATLLITQTGCKAGAQEGFYPQPDAEPTHVVVDTTAVLDSMEVLRDLTVQAWGQDNGHYVCYINEYGHGYAYHMRLAGEERGGGLTAIYQWREGGDLPSRTCYEGWKYDGTAVAIGTCTRRAIFIEQIDAALLDNWAAVHYTFTDEWHQWNITLSTGERVYFALPTENALVFPCDRPPYWEPYLPKPPKREVHQNG